MSQPPHESIDVRTTAPNTGDRQYPPQLAQNQESKGFSNFVDGSGRIFSMYLEMATEEDKKMAENWKDDADGILIFTGLFSAAVASLISVSIQDLQQDPQDTSNFYLANIYQATINPNGANLSSSLPASPPPFVPPNFAVWVNALWFLSLVISITCALLATLLQQWARRYLKITQPRYSPHKRARIRAFFAEGVDKFLLPWAVEALPTMLHLSLFLFFAGLAVFLWNVNLTIFKVVLSWVGLCTALYGCITFIPVFRHDSPYLTPLSLPTWHFITGIPFLTFRALEKLARLFCFSHATYHHFRLLAEHYGKRLLQGMRKTAEETAFNSPPEIDTRAFMWTFDSLDEDHELESFFAGLPGFRSSKVVKDPLPDLTRGEEEKLLNTLIGLFDRTSSSDLLPEPVKNRRNVICRQAIGPADIPRELQQFLRRIISEDEYGPVQSAEIARFVKGWDDGKGEKTAMLSRAIVSSVIARAQRRDDLWFAMASDELGLPKSVLRNRATHRNDLLLSILIHLIRQQFSLLREKHWPYYEFSKVIEAASKFDVLDTSPELQHEFCALWNEVFRAADRAIVKGILEPIRNVNVTLHLPTNSAPTGIPEYLMCTTPAHHPDWTSHIHDAASRTATAHNVLHDNAPLVHATVTTTPYAPSLPEPTPVRVNGTTMDAQLIDNDGFVLAPFRPAHRSPGDSATSTDAAAAASVARDIDTTARTMPLAALATSTSPSSGPSTSAFSLQNNTVLAHSEAPDISPPAFPEQVLEDMLPAESHLSMTRKSPATSPWPTSALELVAATGDEGDPVAGSRADEDALDSPSVNLNHSIQANATAVDPLTELPPLPSAAHIATMDPSRRESDAEHAGDPPSPSHVSHESHDAPLNAPFGP